MVPINARFASGMPPMSSPDDAPTTPTKGSSLINKESPAEAMARHQPDYNATIDHGTSYISKPLLAFFRFSVLAANRVVHFRTFSPVPKRVINGSEPGVLAAALTSGAPTDLQGRTVR